MRLGGNLILTRLLFPEAFGLMAITQAVIFGINMFTDVGIGPSIIQKDRGSEPQFLNTAWTMQVVRGSIVWIVLCILAFPLAKFYSQPLLSSILPVVGLTALIGSFTSVNFHLAIRNMEFARVTMIEIGTYATGLLFTVSFAWLLQSVWGLVWGGVITSCFRVLSTHLVLHGVKDKFAWDRETVDQLKGFGRWILLSSVITFLSTEGLRLLIGALLDMRELALYTLASTMNLFLWQAILALASRAFFPAYAATYRSNPGELVSLVSRIRLLMIIPSWCVSVLFIFFGSELMDSLYDSRYHGSGPMLQLLATGTLVGCLWGSYSGALLATGRAATQTLLSVCQIVSQFCAIFVGYHFWMSKGIIIGLAAANWVMFLFNAVVMSRAGLFKLKQDLPFLGASILVVVWVWPRLSSFV
jgi:O-antigen/teichoic acid export membrane protein